MFNNLTPEEHERITILQEELLEAAHICSKILRHGYESYHPDEHDLNNRELLGKELGDVRFAMIWLCDNGDQNKCYIHEMAKVKSCNIQKYLHHTFVSDVTKDNCK